MREREGRGVEMEREIEARERGGEEKLRGIGGWRGRGEHGGHYSIAVYIALLYGLYSKGDLSWKRLTKRVQHIDSKFL